MLTLTVPRRPGQLPHNTTPTVPPTGALLRLLDLQDCDRTLRADPEFLSLVEDDPPLGEPTDAEAGTEAKIRVFQERLARGQALFHPADGLRRIGESSARGQGDVRGICLFEGRWRVRMTGPAGEQIHVGVYLDSEEAIGALREAKKNLKRGA